MAAFTESDSATAAYPQESLCEHAQELVVSNKRRYLEKIAGIGDPFYIPKTELSKEAFPPVEATDIFNYLVLGYSFCTSQRFKAYKSLDAYKYFVCGFVNCFGSKTYGQRIVTVAKVGVLTGHAASMTCYDVGEALTASK